MFQIKLRGREPMRVRVFMSEFGLEGTLRDLGQGQPQGWLCQHVVCSVYSSNFRKSSEQSTQIKRIASPGVGPALAGAFQAC